MGGGNANLAHIPVRERCKHNHFMLVRNRDKFWLNEPLRLSLNSNFSFFFFLLLCPLLLAVSPQPAPKLKRIKEEDENGKSK